MKPDETAVLVDVGDFDALARRLVEIGRDDKIRERLGRAARRQAEQEFSLPVYKRRLLQLYKSEV